MATKKSINPNARAVYGATGGNDSESGKSPETAKQTIAATITEASNTSPPPSQSDPVVIIWEGGGTLVDESFTLPTSVDLDAPVLNIREESDNVIVTTGSNQHIILESIIQQSTNATDAVTMSGSVQTELTVSLLSHTSPNSNGVHITGTASDVFHKILQLEASGDGSIGVLWEPSAGTGDNVLIYANISLRNDDTVGFRCNSTDDETVVFNVGTVLSFGPISGAIAIDVIQGKASSVLNELDSGSGNTDIHVGALGTYDVFCGMSEQDIVVDSGGVLNCYIIAHNGTITNNGTINGFINGVAFGNAIFPTFYTADGTIDENRTVDILNDNILSISAYQAATATGACSHIKLTGEELLLQFINAGLDDTNIVVEDFITVSDNINSIGMSYVNDYSVAGAASGDRWIPDKGYGNSHIGGNDVDALIITPTVAEDGFAIVWNNTNSEYELSDRIEDTIYTADGTVTGARTVTAVTDFIRIRSDDAVSAATRSQYRVDPTVIQMSYLNNSLADESRIQFNNSGMTVLDDINSKGLVYVADYSANFTDRSLIDKGFADGEYLALSGGTMTGVIDMGSNNIDNIGANNQLDLSNPTGNSLGLGQGAVNASSTGDNNIGVGVSVLASVTSGTSNTALGTNALTALTIGDSNIALGMGAGNALISDVDNVFVGVRAGNTIESSQNVFVGHQAAMDLAATTGDGNTVVGDEAFRDTGGGAGGAGVSNNTVIGRDAGSDPQPGASSNTIVGHVAGNGGISGDSNSLMGHRAGQSITTGNRNIILGFEAEPISGTADDQLTIANMIFGDLTTASLRLGGTGAVSTDHQLELGATDQTLLPNLLTTATEDGLTSVVGQTFFNTSLDALRVESTSGFEYASKANGSIIWARFESDLPAPVSTVITIPRNTVLFIETDLVLSSGNSINLPGSSAIMGHSAISSNLIGNNTGNTLVIDDYLGTDTPINIANIAIANISTGGALQVNDADAEILVKETGFAADIDLVAHTRIVFADSIVLDSTIDFSADNTGSLTVFDGFELLLITSAVDGITIGTNIDIGELRLINFEVNTANANNTGVVLDGTATVTLGIGDRATLNGPGTLLTGFDQASNEWVFTEVQGFPDSTDQAISSVLSTAGATGTEITISAVDTWTDISDGATELTWSLGSGAEKYTLDSTSTGQLSYDGVRSRSEKVGANVLLAGVSGGGTDLLEIGISINGAAPSKGTIRAVVVNNAFISVTIPPIPLALVESDTIRLQVQNTTDGDNITVIAAELVPFF